MDKSGFRKLLSAAAVLGVVVPTAATHADEIAPGFYPAISANLKSSSNIRRTETNPIRDTIATLNPSLFYKGEMGKHNFDIGYTGDYGRYQDRAEENYTDHSLVGRLFLDPDPRLAINLQGGLDRSHEVRGASGATVALTRRPDVWDETQMMGEVILGRRTNKLQLAGAVERLTLRFINNGQQPRDRDIDMLRGTLYFNLGPKTALLAEISKAGYDYIRPTSNLDSTERRYLLGVTWLATGKTTGEIKVGRLEKGQDDPSLKDYNGATWEANVLWEPKTYSRFTFTAKKQTEESALIGDAYFVGKLYGIGWQHDFSERLRSNAYANVREDRFAARNRRDDLSAYGLGLDWAILRWLDLGIQYDHIERDSNVANGTYKDDVVSLRLTAGRK